MPGYGQFCPVAQALEVIGERWTLLVVRELLCGSTRFNELTRGVPLMSRSMLAQRLRSLEDAGVLERRAREGGQGHSYHLTQAGEELRVIVEGCGNWGQRWARRKLSTEHLDAGLLMWDIRRSLNVEALPDETLLVEFQLKGAGQGQRRYWLHIEPEEIDLCLTHPGFEVDLVVRAKLRELTEVWLGDRTLASCLRDGSIELDGPVRLRRAFPTWLMLSGFATVERPA
jgi:DNA-binding HxlR family transcriptional regulator